MYSKILVALDGSDHAQKALDTAVQMTLRCEAELILFHVIKFESLSTGFSERLSSAAREIYESLAQEQADAILGEAEEAARGEGVSKLTRKSVVANSAAQAILDAEKSEAAELLVIGTRGLTGLRELAMGSVAHKVSSLANCPVLIVR